MAYETLISDYLAGPEQLRQAISGMSAEQLSATPVPGAWSTRQVICHIADFEPIYADRMKRVIAEESPQILAGDPDQFAARLAYDRRDLDEELELISVVRRQMGTILLGLSPEQFQRTGHHSRDGALTLETLLKRITGHVPHHLKFIQDKRTALGLK
jgi:uncharacterized damage-inducible protein DinB